MRRPLLALAGVLCVSSTSQAQVVIQNEVATVMPPSDYVLPPPPLVPSGGCVWDNVVYSNGAILERFYQRPFYFRCMSGRWNSYSSLLEAHVGREDPVSLVQGRAPQPGARPGPDGRPVPLTPR